MKLSTLTIPLGVLLFAAGGYMMVKARNFQQENSDSQASRSIDLNQWDKPKHPVNDAMRDAARLMSTKLAPDVTLKSYLDQDVRLGGYEKPQFVLFILWQCPCSIDAQPIMNDLSKQFKGKVDFVGVINKPVAQAKEWRDLYQMPFPTLADPDKAAIHAYGIKQSVYSTLVSKGRIIKVWPGYSKRILEDINQTLAAEIGEKARPFDPKYAPKEDTSGCYFDE
ncbi:MAG: redoxin domain-containing protein [Armatimonadetes bacterium]|nr:redoxin domain-containing protein [Armatimonadota bacterium]